MFIVEKPVELDDVFVAQKVVNVDFPHDQFFRVHPLHQLLVHHFEGDWVSNVFLGGQIDVPELPLAEQLSNFKVLDLELIKLNLVLLELPGSDLGLFLALLGLLEGILDFERVEDLRGVLNPFGGMLLGVVEELLVRLRVLISLLLLDVFLLVERLPLQATHLLDCFLQILGDRVVGLVFLLALEVFHVIRAEVSLHPFERFVVFQLGL